MNNKKLKNKSYQSEDIKEIKALVIITLIIIAVAVGLYFITEKALDKKKESESISEATISYSETLIGEMFDKAYAEYYVFIYSSKDDNAKKYENLITTYNDKEDAIKIFYADLANKFNSYALKEASNPSPTSAKDVAVKDVGLVLIKDGKVSKYYETLETIEKVLK